MGAINPDKKLPRIIRTGTTSTILPDDKLPALDESKPLYIRLGVLETYRTTYTPIEIGMGPADQVLSVAPSETVEIILETSTRRTVEREENIELTESAANSSEDKVEKELTDSVASIIQKTSTSSVSMSAGGTISVLSVSAGTSATYETTQTNSHETTSRVVRQATQRVSSEQSKRYVIKTRSVQETSERELHRRVISNASQLSQHYALRSCFQIGRVSIQYLGPRLIIQQQVNEPGSFLLAPRLISEQVWPAPPKALRNSLISVDRTIDSKALGPGWSFDGVVVRNLLAVIVGASFSNGSKKIKWIISDGTANSPWTATLEAEISKYTEVQANRQELPISIRKVSSTGNLPAKPPTTVFQIPTINTFYLDRSQYEILEQSLRVGGDSDLFHQHYAALLSAMDNAPRRQPADLRFEERETLLSQLSASWGNGGKISSYSYFNGFSDLFDIEASYYFLAPTSARIDLPPVAPGGVFDTSTGSVAARLGMGLGWKTHFDGDDRRSEFLNAPSALINLPVRKGRESEALVFLEQNSVYTIPTYASNMASLIAGRIRQERDAQEKGLSEDSVRQDVVTSKEGSGVQLSEAEKLFPVKSVFEYQEPVDGFLYEQLSL